MDSRFRRSPLGHDGPSQRRRHRGASPRPRALSAEPPEAILSRALQRIVRQGRRGPAPERARAIAWLGMRYGMSCLGCCWVLMLLLFVGGLMNVLWIAAIALLVIAEKNLPWGSRIALLAGAGLIAWGGVSLTTAALCTLPLIPSR